DQLRELTPILFVAGTATIRGKIELVPPFVLSLWRQRHLAGFLVADQVAAHGDHRLGALWPECCEDVGSPCSPIKTGQDRLLDPESIQQSHEIHGEGRRLAVPNRVIRKKSRRAIAAQEWNDHPVAG